MYGYDTKSNPSFPPSRYERPSYDQPRYNQPRYDDSSYNEPRYDRSRYDRPRQDGFSNQTLYRPSSPNGYQQPSPISRQDGFSNQALYQPSSPNSYQQPSPIASNEPPSYEAAVYQPDNYRSSSLQPIYRQPLSEKRSRSPSPLPPSRSGPPSPLLQPSHSRQPSSTGSSKLGKPIAIPATLAAYGSPFLRAYPPALAAYSIPPSTFLAFLDTLNRVAEKSPPLQALGLAGNVIGFVPSAAAQMAGGIINLTAGVATGVLQHGRTEIELKRANEELFRPRGLKVEIAKTEALAKLAGIPGVLDASNKLNKKARLLMPLEPIDMTSTASISGQERRLESMRPWIAELDVTPLPDIDQPTNALSRLTVKANERNRAKGEKKLIEKRGKAAEEFNKESRKARRELDKEMDKIERERDKDLRDVDKKLDEADRKGRNADRWERERERILNRFEREKTKVEERYQREIDKADVGSLSDDEEEKNMRKLYWLVIRDINAPSGWGPNPDM